MTRFAGLNNVKTKFRICFVLALVVVLVSAISIFPRIASAASLTALSDTMSRIQKSQASNHTIKYTTPAAGGVAAGETMALTFPSGFTIGSVDYTDIDVSWGPSTGAENELTLAGTPSGSTWGVSFSGQVLTIESGSGTISASSKIIVEIGTNASGGDQQIANHATAATYTISIAGTFGDTGKIAIVILDSDQFTVNATVDPTLTFSLTQSSTSFGSLSTSSVTTSSPNVGLTISTNAPNGYTIKINDAGDGNNPGLYNSTLSAIIGSGDYSYNNTADLTSVAGYGIQASSATATIASPYDGTSDTVGGYELTPQNLATYAGTASSHAVTITSKAKVNGATPPGTYNDTVTLIATGNF